MANGTVYLSPIDENSPVTRKYAENHFLGQLATMPAASLEYKDKIVQYVGTTTADYTNGYFYVCVESGGSYTWTQTNVQPGGATILSGTTDPTAAQGNDGDVYIKYTA